MKRLGKIRISSELILQLIWYPECAIREAKYHYPSDNIELLLEGGDMPELEPGREPELVRLPYLQDRRLWRIKHSDGRLWKIRYADGSIGYED